MNANMYKLEDFKGDLNAGVIVAIMIIPQSMAYAMIAGLPPIIGLYSATIPMMIYALMASSRHVSVGPVAIVSLLVFSGASLIETPGTAEYFSLVLLLSFLSGIIQLAMGALKLGHLFMKLPHSVVSGFISSAAIIIGFSQLPHLLNIQIKSSSNLFSSLKELGTKLDEVNLPTLIISLSCITLLIFLRNNFPRFPAQLVVIVASICAVYYLNLSEQNVSIVGEIPSSLPSLTMPVLNLEMIKTLFPIACTIAVIGFVESIAMAKLIAEKEGYTVNPNREITALGSANIASAFFSGYPVAGGVSRSAVNHQAGAKSRMASVITACLVLLIILFLSPLFYFLPEAALASIIIVAVYSLIDFKYMKEAFLENRSTGMTLMITFLTSLLYGIEKGFLIGLCFFVLMYAGKVVKLNVR
ncbi:sodium-independent anion transporter [Salipaludibacillus neizhouensis]|uniref:Sodium-independent anion transporter n=1 Tax=Salipaludibacillus neizhouensis TaxID=885475 RepID=A0A3A9K516_9BACI|nr:SulP family inorganic anion transporter [Salipaludibacillus neizhouensis]RKL67409.1 sodium-independent anion transporter [Salipaludibacillus neizhouensis]